MILPDAPWVGKCREDYYCYVDEDEYFDDCLVDEEEGADDELYG